MSDSPELTASGKPRGIALVICCKITWDIPLDDAPARNPSCPRDIIRTFDTLTVDKFPGTTPPLAVYVLVSGAGNAALSLLLEAPNGEIVVAYHKVADNWGALGTWEWPVLLSEFPLNHPGIYHWQLCHGDDVLLDRPMLVKLRS